MSKTECYSCFVVESAGTYREPLGFVAAENSDFDPDELTSLLKERPFRERRMGAPRKSGHGLYPYSRWYGCRQTRPTLDAAEQCEKIAARLKPLIPQLKDFRSRHNVEFLLLVSPTIGNSLPTIHFSRAVVEFCQEVGAEIGIDLRLAEDE